MVSIVCCLGHEHPFTRSDYVVAFPYGFVFYNIPLMNVEYNIPLGYINDANSQVMLHVTLGAIHSVFKCDLRPKSRS